MNRMIAEDKSRLEMVRLRPQMIGIQKIIGAIATTIRMRRQIAGDSIKSQMEGFAGKSIKISTMGRR